jgi:hypothetical protein
MLVMDRTDDPSCTSTLAGGPCSGTSKFTAYALLAPYLVIHFIDPLQNVRMSLQFHARRESIVPKLRIIAAC